MTALTEKSGDTEMFPRLWETPTHIVENICTIGVCTHNMEAFYAWDGNFMKDDLG